MPEWHRGLPYPTTVALEVWDGVIHDPNGYYRLLGITGRIVSWTQEQIDRRCARLLAEAHPDRGDWDQDRWEALENARECLTNPANRFTYDRLGPDQRWWDKTHRRKYGPPSGSPRPYPEESFPYEYWTDGVEPLESDIYRALRSVAESLRGHERFARVGLTVNDERIEDGVVFVRLRPLVYS